VVAGVGDAAEADQPPRLFGSARSAIGARVPSTSVRIALRVGSSRSGSSSGLQFGSAV